MKRNTAKQITKTLALSAMVFMSLPSCEKNGDIDTTPTVAALPSTDYSYTIVGTNQTTSFNNSTTISKPAVGEEFYGQNSNNPGNEPRYQNNGDGTVTDLVSGLMWQQSFDHNADGNVDYNDKLSYDEILTIPSTINTGGYTDWRVPTIKEMYSLIIFSGRDISVEETNSEGLVPFINTDMFEFAYGDTNAGERMIDVQCATTNVYVSDEVDRTIFGVNFADGRIKGYGDQMMGQAKAFNYLLVRGSNEYGVNKFVNNGDGTITDNATGLMWMQDDNAAGINWQEALVYAEGKEFAGYSDWRLPDAKELQSIVDYTRSPASSNSAAIDPIFNCTQITNEAGEMDFPWYWSSTTHANMVAGNEGSWGAYVAFGRCLGNMSTITDVPPLGGDSILPPPPNGTTPPNTGISTVETNWTDVHGAGAQRSDPKAGDASEYADGHGPQGDAVRVYNYVRLVRNIK